jgi:hypothetical protein
MDEDLALADWEEELAYALSTGPGAWSLMTVAVCSEVAAAEKVVAAARKVVTAAGLPIFELDARHAEADPRLLPQGPGYVILRDVGVPLRIAVPVLIGGFQHLVQRGLLVGIVLGSPAGIRALRQEASMGFISRAEVLHL